MRQPCSATERYYQICTCKTYNYKLVDPREPYFSVLHACTNSHRLGVTPDPVKSEALATFCMEVNFVDTLPLYDLR